MMINNNHQLSSIPLSFLTRIEKPHDVLYSLPILSQLTIDNEQSLFYPFHQTQLIDQLQAYYQSLCQYHTKSILDCQYQKNQYIYVSMQHIKQFIKSYDLQFYNVELFKQFHIVLQLLSYDDKNIIVKPVIINEKNCYLKNQKKTNEQDKKFNLIYQIKNYIHCPYCVPTLCSTILMYKNTNLTIPKSLSYVDEKYKKAFVLVKNDRIDLVTLFNLSQIKWKCSTYDEYSKKMELIGNQHQWQYYHIINMIHKLHYNTMKFYERVKEPKSNWNETKNKANSPTWRK